jgi:RNA-directed DNA polymerase
MIYEQIEYQVRASLGRNEWVILIYYPDNPEGKSTTAKFTGTKAEAAGAARSAPSVQRAAIALLNAIYEEDFLGISYGVRPGRGAHDALDD